MGGESKEKKKKKKKPSRSAGAVPRHCPLIYVIKILGLRKKKRKEPCISHEQGGFWVYVYAGSARRIIINPSA